MKALHAAGLFRCIVLPPTWMASLVRSKIDPHFLRPVLKCHCSTEQAHSEAWCARASFHFANVVQLWSSCGEGVPGRHVSRKQRAVRGVLLVKSTRGIIDDTVRLHSRASHMRLHLIMGAPSWQQLQQRWTLISFRCVSRHVFGVSTRPTCLSTHATLLLQGTTLVLVCHLRNAFS